MKKHSFQYGSYFVGWIPAEKMQSGGRFVFFRSFNEYEEAYKRVTETAKKQDLDKLLKAANVCGGKSRSQLSWKTRGRW